MNTGVKHLMSIQYRFVNPSTKQQTEALNRFLKQKQEELLRDAEQFLQNAPDLEDGKELCDEILDSTVFQMRNYNVMEHEIGVRSMNGFTFTATYGQGIRSIEDLRRFQAEHPDWIIETSEQDPVSLEEIVQVIQESPKITIR